jgi:predicted Zn-dependent peptidase
MTHATAGREAEADTHLATLANGVRVLTLRQPHLATATACVFVASGSAHERPAESGIGHVVEHMLFKGTARRDAARINLDAERLGAEVNAHTDKDHTALHMSGLAAHAADFVQQLGELVREPTFPAEELERERQVLLQEHAEDSDDPVATGFKLFDRSCFGTHPAAQPVIGPRHNLERFRRQDLLDWTQRQFSGTNVVVGIAGPVDPDEMLRHAAEAFGALPACAPHRLAPPAYGGGIATQRSAGSSQTHLVLGFGLPALADEDVAATVAAAVLGDGMSSPLLQALREREGLAYHAAASADVLAVCGQFVVEASTAPEQFERALAAVARLLARHAEAVDPVDLERARNQLAVRLLRARERPLRRLEDAALDLFTFGRVRPLAERLAAVQGVGSDAVRDAFARLLDAGPSVAVTGEVPRGTRDRVRRVLAAAGVPTAG